MLSYQESVPVPPLIAVLAPAQQAQNALPTLPQQAQTTVPAPAPQTQATLPTPAPQAQTTLPTPAPQAQTALPEPAPQAQTAPSTITPASKGKGGKAAVYSPADLHTIQAAAEELRHGKRPRAEVIKEAAQKLQRTVNAVRERIRLVGAKQKAANLPVEQRIVVVLPTS